MDQSEIKRNPTANRIYTGLNTETPVTFPTLPSYENATITTVTFTDDAVGTSTSSAISSYIDSNSFVRNYKPPTKNNVTSKRINETNISPDDRETVNAYIFNNKYCKFLGEEERHGTDKDVERLKETFSYLQLKTEVIMDPTKADIRNKASEIANKDFTNCPCLVFALLSHGGRNDVMAADDDYYNIHDDLLFHILKNDTLKNKPKIFFIQACKGILKKDTVYTDSASQLQTANEVLICYSSFEGFVSYRTCNGTPFITTLCESLKNDAAEMHIEKIMKNVIEKIKKDSDDKQIPSMTTTLTGKFKFPGLGHKQ